MGPVPPELIVAARLTLVPLRPEHAAEMAPVLADPDLYTFTGGAPPRAAELRARFERWAAGPGDPALSWDNWVIQLCPHGALAGYVQATVTDAAGTLAAELAWVVGNTLAAELAWVVGKPWQGRGIGSEAARALAGWLGRHHVRSIVAHIHPDNRASAAVASAVGLTPTGEWQDGEQRWRMTVG
jgi:RimJ/RimL family protein N-acetyltransferase